MTDTDKKRKPWLGLLGMGLMLFGCVVFGLSGSDGTLVIAAAGLLILIVALLTGNVKLFG